MSTKLMFGRNLMEIETSIFKVVKVKVHKRWPLTPHLSDMPLLPIILKGTSFSTSGVIFDQKL